MTPPPLSLSCNTTANTAPTSVGGTTTTNTAVCITDCLQKEPEPEQAKLQDTDSCSVGDSGVGFVDDDDDDDDDDGDDKDDDDCNTTAAATTTTTTTTTTVVSDGINNNCNLYYDDLPNHTTANTISGVNTAIDTADTTSYIHEHIDHHHHYHHHNSNNEADCCGVDETEQAEGGGVGVGDRVVTAPPWDGRRERGDARVRERAAAAAPVRNEEQVKHTVVDYLYEQTDLHQQLEHQKDVIKLLEDQLQETEKKSKHLEQDLRQQIEELSKENERQKQVISQLNSIATNLSSKTGDEISVTMGQDIIRITTENLELRETVSKQTEQIRKLKKTLKVYARKLKAGEGPFRRFQSLVSATSLSPTSAAEIAAELDRDEQEESGVMAAVKHQEREYLGMLEYNKTDETALIKNLVFDLQPYVAESMLPGLPAYIIFMCIRHTDHINEDDKVCSLLTGVVNGIKRVVKKNTNDIERVTLWLANCCRLLHNLKQYSGEKRYQNTNSPKQNEHCLRNFDLSEYRPVFNDLCVYNYRQLIKVMKENLDKLIVPAILEHEAIAGLNKEDRRGRIPNNEVEPDALDNLQKIMSKYIRILRNHAVDPEVIVLIVKQLFYDMSVKALNNLLLRRDMCNWHKGTQIRYNISHLEQWLREYHLQDSGAFVTMEPLIQASQLLQARKTDADVDSVCQMCPKLKTAQIVKILNQYTPVRGYEDDTVAISFIRKVQEKLAESRQNDTGTNLLMDTQYSFPVTFPFNPSNIALERVTVPDKLHLAFLKRV